VCFNLPTCETLARTRRAGVPKNVRRYSDQVPHDSGEMGISYFRYVVTRYNWYTHAPRY